MYSIKTKRLTIKCTQSSHHLHVAIGKQLNPTINMNPFEPNHYKSLILVTMLIFMATENYIIRITKRNMIHLTAWIYNFILCFNKDFLPSVTCNTLSPVREWPKYINIITSKRNLSSYEFVWSWQTKRINYTVFKHGIQTKLLDIEWNSPLANLFIGINILCLKLDLWHYIWYKQINHN